MRLQARFLLLFALVFLIGAGAFVAQHELEAHRLDRVQKSELGQENNYFKSITSLEGQAMQIMQTDYSFWDEMVAFVKSDDKTFAEENIDTSLDTYSVDDAAVYRPNGTLVYHASAGVTPVTLDLSPAFFTELKAAKLMHFYEQDGGNIIEVRAATIVPSDDGDHATPAQGFWIIDRVLGSDYTSRLSDLTSGNVKLTGSTGATGSVVIGDVLSVTLPFKDWSGAPVASLNETRADAATTELNHLYSEELLLFAMFALLCIALVVFVVWLQVLKPIKLITTAIKDQHPERLDRLGQHESEFGKLAGTIQEFFRQKLVIEQGEFVRGELEKLNREKTAFLATAAHELSSPVNTIKIISEFLASGFDKTNPDEIKKQLGIIEHLTVKMNLLISDMRLSKLGQFSELQYAEFDFDDFLNREILEASYTAKQKIIREDAGTGVRLSSDPGRLSQVVSNLIRNADKYSPGGNQIIVRCHTANDSVVVEVQDFGIGISKDDQAHIFQQFFRSAAVMGSYPGLGLGLSISKQLVEKLGGQLWVESELGKGSTFFFNIPLKLSTPATPPATPPTTPPPAN